ncbi:SURF1 family protein [Sphingomonas jatrophae]|uniref:SURF1-like protein n=1 Tax=Sphingomonas jatrophae TaxID=1166337 RepID=A0A1I6JAP8_9SPHN|nr:SURF1 family cytochrome oxidase biogenesis protein [Sphingomonas jatrophae]SFR76014.1 surfeit locus 1 family protein [Sphingomonas jatrophae]
MRRGRLLLAACAALAALVLAGLGVWQIERRAWKLALIERVDARIAAPARPLPPPAAWPALAQDGAYLRVRLAGVWKPVRPALVKAVTDLGGGWWVMSPLQTATGVVLVNRGFVPDALKGSIAPVSGPAEIEGLLRLDEPGGGFLRRNDPAADRWFSRDVRAIAHARGVRDPAPFFIDAKAEGPGWPRGGLTVVRFRNAHLVYALTWFALAGIAAVFAWAVARRPRGAQDGRR